MSTILLEIIGSFQLQLRNLIQTFNQVFCALVLQAFSLLTIIIGFIRRVKGFTEEHYSEKGWRKNSR